VNYLLDTNIISEVRKGPRCNSKVAGWYASVDDAEIYLSVLVLGEIRKGLELLDRATLLGSGLSRIGWRP